MVCRHLEDENFDMAKVIASIDDHVKAGLEIPQSPEEEISEKYIGLLNCYQLLIQCLPVREYPHYETYDMDYPAITEVQLESAETELTFNINALRLIGKIPTTPDFHGFDLSKPFYPSTLQIVREEKISLRKGIKISDEYYPYKQANKLYWGDVGNNTFMATNGKKILFIRGVEVYPPQAILASKIATLVSPSHFSSERLLDNRLAGSRGISSYAISVVDPQIKAEIKKYIAQKKPVLHGTGIIDEVTNFVQEWDANPENVGLSSKNLEEAHLSKIDFDGCSVDEKIEKNDYERDMLTKLGRGIYSMASHVRQDPQYIKEKLFARLKLSMLNEPLISKLAEKAYIAENDDKRMPAINELTNRSNIALELFLEHPEAESFLRTNSAVISQCYYEIENYISTHFEQKDQELLQD